MLMDETRLASSVREALGGADANLTIDGKAEESGSPAAIERL
jgi:hypothetical protein